MKYERPSYIVDFFPNHFYMHRTSSAYAAAVASSRLFHDLENPTPESQLKFEETALAAIKKCQKFSNLQ